MSVGLASEWLGVVIALLDQVRYLTRLHREEHHCCYEEQPHRDS